MVFFFANKTSLQWGEHHNTPEKENILYLKLRLKYSEIIILIFIFPFPHFQ